MNTWSLQDAKARFSELVNRCLKEGAQQVTRHGKPAVVVIPAAEFHRITAPRNDLADFFLSAPRIDLNISRPPDYGREIQL